MTITLPAETEAKLHRLAAQTGLTVEGYLAFLVDHAALSGNGSVGNHIEEDAADEDEGEEERPWRGVLVLERPRAMLFTQPALPHGADLPRRAPSLNMSWHKADVVDV